MFAGHTLEEAEEFISSKWANDPAEEAKETGKELDEKYAASRRRSEALELHEQRPSELQRLNALRREAYDDGRLDDVRRLDSTIDIVERSTRS